MYPARKLICCGLLVLRAVTVAGIITLFSANSFAQAEVVEAQPETAGAQAGVAGAKQAQAEVVETQAEGAQAEEVQAQPEVKPEPSVDYYTIGQRFSVDSKVLGNKRNYQIYLPPSYYSQPQANFPVLYLLNGGYHFHAYTGLVEDLSNSQLIPELIVVGLGRGDEQSYRRQMRPDFGKNSDGEAEQFLQFLETELKPQLRQQYRMADYEILMGQSIGGVFAIYSLFTQPESFNSYISVSPMLWWQEHKLEAEAAKFLKQLGAPKKNLYLSMANEKRLGVYGLVEQLERARNQWLGWDFKRYPEENSQSIGLVAARAALRDLFKGWYLSYDELAGFKGFEEVSEHYRTLLKRFNLHQAIPLFSFQALAHQYRSSAREEESGLMYLQTMQHMPSSASRLRHHLAELEIKNKSYDKALELIRESHTVNPHDYQVPRLLAKIELARGDKTKAREYAQEALLLAEKLQLRPWQLRALAAELAQLASE